MGSAALHDRAWPVRRQRFFSPRQPIEKDLSRHTQNLIVAARIEM